MEPYIVTLIPKITAGDSQHQRDGDEVIARGIRLKWFVRAPMGYLPNTTSVVQAWEEAGTVTASSYYPTSLAPTVVTQFTTGNNANVTATKDEKYTPPFNVKVLIVERTQGFQLPHYTAQGQIDTHTTAPRPTFNDFFDNIGPLDDPYNIQQVAYATDLRMWTLKPRSEFTGDFRIVFHKDYRVGKNGFYDQVYLPFHKKVEFIPASSTDDGSNQPLNRQLYFMLVHDFGEDERQGLVTQDDQRVRLSQFTRFTWVG
jgi:hypothetical protein